jgi:hypothetical protein
MDSIEDIKRKIRLKKDTIAYLSRCLCGISPKLSIYKEYEKKKIEAQKDLSDLKKQIQQ